MNRKKKIIILVVIFIFSLVLIGVLYIASVSGKQILRKYDSLQTDIVRLKDKAVCKMKGGEYVKHETWGWSHRVWYECESKDRLLMEVETPKCTQVGEDCIYLDVEGIQ